VRAAPLFALLRRWLGLPAWVRALLPSALAGAIWWGSSLTPAPRPPDPLRDWLHNGAHVVAFAALAGAILLSGPVGPRATLPPGRGWPVTSALLGAAYGAIDEWHQSFVPGRCSSYGDLLSDACGAVLGVAVVSALLCDRSVARWLPCWLLVCVGAVSFETWPLW